MAGRGSRPAVRLISLLVVFTFTFVLVAGRLVQLQVVQAEPLEARGAQQRLRTVEIPAKRGAIFDRKMTPLALSTEARDVIADPAFVSDPGAGARLLAPILGLTEAALEERLSRPGRFVYLARKVSPAVADRVEALNLGFVFLRPAMQRSYPADAVAGQVLGFVGTDDVGLAGLEFAYEQTLAGMPGQEILEQDPAGRPIPHGRHSILQPEAGRGIVLTIDRDLQFFAEAALARGVRSTSARGGVAIVLDTKTGDVLAMVNHPALDPESFGRVTPHDRRNRAATDAYEPGSINKVVTAAAALEAGLVTPSTKLTVPDRIKVGGRSFRDFEPHRTEKLTYAEALARSSNVGTIKVAQMVGRDRLFKMLRRFGYGTATGLGFPGESDGILRPLDQWYGTSMGTVPIGQGIAVTPLQMASVYATLANDGVRVQPRLVKAVVERDGRVEPSELGERRPVVSAYTAAQIRAMLVGVVEHGTGSRAKIPGYLVGGKTGTARVPYPDRPGYSRDIITSFVGFAPANDPRVVVFVSLDNPRPRFSALTAAPVFREIMAHTLSSLGVVPSVAALDAGSLIARRAPAPPAPSPVATATVTAAARTDPGREQTP